MRISDWSSDVCSSDLFGDRQILNGDAGQVDHDSFAVAEIPRSAEQQAELPDRRRVDQPGAHRPAGLAMIDALIPRIDDDRGRGEDRRVQLALSPRVGAAGADPRARPAPPPGATYPHSP